MGTMSSDEFFAQEEGTNNPDKSPEEKIFLLLSIIDDDDTSGIFNVCVGRTECYKTIGRLLESYDDYDVDKSLVLVETKQINSKTHNPEYFLTNYLRSSNGYPLSVYSFCKQVEWYFENRADVEFIDIDNYKRESTEDEEETKLSTINMGGTSVAVNNTIGVNKEAYSIWIEAIKGLE